MIEFPGRVADVLDVAHALPLHEPFEGPLTIVLGPTQETQVALLRALYPEARTSEVRNANGALFFRAVDLTADQVRARTGLTLATDGAAPTVGDPFAPPAGSGRRTWSGQIYWHSDRPLEIEVVADQPTSVQIADQAPIAAGGGQPVTATLELPRGWQPIRIEDSGDSHLRVALSNDGPQRSLSRWQLRPDSERQGLNAVYTLADTRTVAMLDPQINAFVVEQRMPPTARVRTPFSAVWRGQLRVDTPGTYSFDAVGSGPYRVALDGQPLFAVDQVVPEQPEEKRGERQLDAGLHPIEVHFESPKLAHTTRRIFQLFWTPPGGERQLIPPTHLVP